MNVVAAEQPRQFGELGDGSVRGVAPVVDGAFSSNQRVLTACCVIGLAVTLPVMTSRH